MTDKEFKQQANDVAEIALDYYRGWFDKDNEEDQITLEQLDFDLETCEPLKNRFVKEALADYLQMMQEDENVSYSNHFDTATAIQTIKKTFAVGLA